MSTHDHAHHDHDHDHDHGHDHKPHRGHDHSGHDHGHGHGGHSHGGHGHVHTSNETRLKIALVITAVFMLVEVGGGLIAGSLALIADAVHMLTDAASLVLALIALRISKRPADQTFSYGHHRYEVLAAFVNGLALLLLSGWIIVESAQRLLSPQPVIGSVMLWIAAGGFAANLISFLVLRDGEDTLNMRAALIHIIGDLLGSAAAIVAALVILYSGWTPIDPILSAFVAALILRSGWRITRQSAHILLEAVPSGIDTEAVTIDLIANVPGLTGIHHLHAWSLTDAHPMMTMHAQIDEQRITADTALEAIRLRLKAAFKIEHVTVQIEQGGCADPDPQHGCHGHAKAA